jgi:hypothetical protein
MSPELAIECPDRPYPGIEAFRYSDHPVFFAREAESERLLRLITVYRSVLVFGPSGAGKSSLINAGFIPRALDEDFITDRIRLQPRPNQELIVERIVRHGNGARPSYLHSTLISEENGSSRQVLSIGEFQDRIAARQSEGITPVLIFDQFEEFVSLFEEAPHGDTLLLTRKVQADLLDLFVALYRDPDLRVKLLFVFREDYLAKLGKLFNRCPDLRDTFLHLTPPRESALEEIIMGPFRRFPGRFPHAFSDALARRLQFALEERCDRSDLNLSEVQIACQRLWRSVDQERAFAVKGLQGLLEDYLAESLGRLPADLRDPAVALLSRMVTAQGLRNVISEEDLIARTTQEEGTLRRNKAEAALAALVADTRLVRRERRDDVVFFEIVSEFLSPWIQRQRMLRRTRALRRRWAALAAVLLFIALISVAATVWVLRKRTESALAREEVRNAKAAEIVARSYAQYAERERARLENELGAAEAERKAALTSLDAAQTALSRIPSQSQLQAQLNQVTRASQQLFSENAELSQTNKMLRQQLEQARKGTPIRSSVATPSSAVVLRGVVHSGELAVYTGEPFNLGIGCFVFETVPASAVRSGIALVAVAGNAGVWQKNVSKASEQLRSEAVRMFRELESKKDTHRNEAGSNALKSMKAQLDKTLPGIAGLYSSISRSAGGRDAEPYTVPFEFKDARYELRVAPRGAGEFQVSVVRTGAKVN